MRSRLFRYSLGLTLCLASLVATSGCARPDGEPEDQTETESSALEQHAPLDTPAAHVPGLIPGQRLDRQQVAALGKLAPAAVGESCPTAGVQCAPPVNSIVRECGGFTDTCDSSGTEDIIPLFFACVHDFRFPLDQNINVCTAIAGQTQQTIACTVPTDGRACSTGCGGSSCAPYANECITDTNRVRGCLSGGHCSNDSCVDQTFTQEIVGTCTRETEGNSCHPLQPCQAPKVGLCNVNHLCACLLGRQ